MTNNSDGIKAFSCDLCLAVCYLGTLKLFKGDFILIIFFKKKKLAFFLWQQHQINQVEGKDQLFVF